MNFNIQKRSNSIEQELQHKIDFKTKPLGSLGVLETIAKQIGSIQNTLKPKINKPSIVVFAGDHGVVNNHPVSPFPQEVTSQMVLNFLNGGAAINVFSNLNQLDLKVVDSGVDFDFVSDKNLINSKVAKGTKDYTKEKAMTLEQCQVAIESGSKIIQNMHALGCNTIGFGEMGIGNTSSASLIMSAITKLSIEDCTGKGTGHSDEGVLTKINILKQAQSKHSNAKTPLEILAAFGGFEIAMMTGAFWKAAELNMTIVVDGFIVTSALLLASAMDKNILDYCIFSHHSGEKGHGKMLDYLNVKPLLNLGLRLGEGTGAALAMPTIKASVTFLNEMASFEDAGVTNK